MHKYLLSETYLWLWYGYTV